MLSQKNDIGQLPVTLTTDNIIKTICESKMAQKVNWSLNINLLAFISYAHVWFIISWRYYICFLVPDDSARKNFICYYVVYINWLESHEATDLLMFSTTTH